MACCPNCLPGMPIWNTLLNGAETGAVFKRTYYQYGWMGELEVTTRTPLIFRESDATLYLWNEALSAFDTLIQFGAAPGDTWRTTTDYDAAGEESMSTTVIDNRAYRNQCGELAMDAR